MKFQEVYEWWQGSRLTQEEAAVLLGVCERTFRRYCRKHESQGAEGLYDHRLEKKAHNTAPVDEVVELLTLFETRYANFTVSHFYDKYRDDHKGQRSYSWVKNQLQSSGLAKKTKKRGAHRRKRERAPMAGMLIHQDGSRHEWVPGEYWDLIVTMDDATSEVYSGFFVEEEGTHSSFQGVSEVITQHGLFCSLYTDRGSHYWTTPKVGGKVDKVNLTQFGRAMKELHIDMIAAYSPEARGRSERLFGTVQQRLPKELEQAGIVSMEEANRFLKEVYWPKHNERFSVKAKDTVRAFVPLKDSGMNLQDILCIIEKRTAGKDNTVSYRNKTLQIPEQSYRYSFNRLDVHVHEYYDGSLALFHGPRKLGDYDKAGNLVSKNKTKKKKTVKTKPEMKTDSGANETAQLTHRAHKAIRAKKGSPAMWTCG